MTLLNSSTKPTTQAATQPGTQMTTQPATQPATQPLTPKEKVVLEFLEMYARLHGFAPTYQEICKHFGFASFNSAQRYLKQLEAKEYVSLGGANQKRAISLLRSASAYQENVEDRGRKESFGRDSFSRGLNNGDDAATSEDSGGRATAEAFQIPMLGRVAAGAPLEAYENDEFIDVPSSLVKNPDRTFALRVQGQSMIEDGIFDGDVILVQRQSQAENGEIVVAVVPSEHGPEEATVKRFFLQAVSDNDVDVDLEKTANTIRLTKTKSSAKSKKRIELRPANSTMTSFWYSPGEVQIRGVVVGLIRRFW
jgi:repressor LexA